MATRELYIEMRIPLNGEMFDDAERISALKGVVSALERSADGAFGSGNFTIHSRIKTYRSKADAAAADDAVDTDTDSVNLSVSKMGNEG